jgi:hypothetical protein
MQPRPDRWSYATVDMKDGRSVAGLVDEYTIDEVPSEQREIVLRRVNDIPICLKLRPADPAFHPIKDRYAILSGEAITGIGVKHVPRPARKVGSASKRSRVPGIFNRDRRD